MVLGFISLLLTFGQSYIAKICIPEKAANTMLPCNLQKKSEEEHDAGRRLLWDLATNSSTRRALASDVPSSCSKVSIISQKCCHFGISRSYDLCNYVIAIPQPKQSHIRYKKRVGAVYNSTHETIKQSQIFFFFLLEEEESVANHKLFNSCYLQYCNLDTMLMLQLGLCVSLLRCLCIVSITFTMLCWCETLTLSPCH